VNIKSSGFARGRTRRHLATGQTALQPYRAGSRIQAAAARAQLAQSGLKEREILEHKIHVNGAAIVAGENIAEKLGIDQ
jgi:hypothetical protein